MEKDKAKLVLDHMPLAKRLARKYKNAYVHFDDALSVAYVGLCEAADRYNPEAGPFPPFAQHRIRGAIIDYIRRNCPNKRSQEHVGVVISQLAVDNTFCSSDLEGRVNNLVTLERLLENCTPKEIEHFRLTYFEGFTQLEIAEKLGISKENAYFRISALCKKIRDKMKRNLVNNLS